MGFGFGPGRHGRNNIPGDAESGDPGQKPPFPKPTLGALTGAFLLPENATANSEAGRIVGQTSGSTLSLINDAGGRVQLTGNIIKRGPTGLDFEVAASHSFTVRENLPGSTNNPRDSVMKLSVTDVADGPALSPLSGIFTLSEDADRGAEAGRISGQSASSTLSLVNDAGGRVQLAGNAIQRGPTALDFEVAGNHSFTVRETLNGSRNSPRDTLLTLAVTDVAEGLPLASLAGTFTLKEDAAEGAEAGQITGQTPGSTLLLVDDAGGCVQLVGSVIRRGPTALDHESAPTITFTVREVLAGSPNSPRNNVFTLSVTDVADGPALSPLMGQFTLAEDAQKGTPAGILTDRAAGSTLELIDDAGGRVQLVGDEIQHAGGALDYEAATEHSFAVRETLAGSANSPLDTRLTLNVTNVLEGATLSQLAGASALREDALQGVQAGSLTNKTVGSTLSLVDDAGGRVALMGSTIVRGSTPLDYESAQSHPFVVREELADSPNSPRDTSFTLDVANVQEAAALNELGGTFILAENAIRGTSAGTIIGVTAGSTLELVDNAGGRVQLNGNVIEQGTTMLDFETASLHTFKLRETLAESVNSPRETVLNLSVTDVAEGGPAPQFNLLALDATAHEGGDRTFKFEVSASFAPTVETIVSWRTKGDGTSRAAEPEDLVGGESGTWPSGSVKFTPGQSANRSFTVAVIDDLLVEVSQRLIVEIFAVSPAGTIGTARQTCSIVDNDTSPTLVALGGTFVLSEDAAQGTLAGTLTGRMAGSTLSLIDDAGGRLTIDSANGRIQRGPVALDYEQASSHSFTVRETLTGATNTPRDTVLTLSVTNVDDGPLLVPLSGSFALAENAPQGQEAGQISGPAEGSTLSLVDDAGGSVQLVGNVIQRGAKALDYEASTSQSFTVREVLAGSPNSPLDTVLTLNVSDFDENEPFIKPPPPPIEEPNPAPDPDQGSLPEVTPSAAWTGAPGSGFTPETLPVPVDPIRTVAKPALRIATPTNQYFTDRQTVIVIAGANQNGSLMNTMGIEKVEFFYEGNSVEAIDPAFHEYTDARGNKKSVFGWAATLKNDGRFGHGRLYVRATSRNPAHQARVQGPFQFSPQKNEHDIELEVGASGNEVVGQRYKTLETALNYLKSVKAENPCINITESSTYDLRANASVYVGQGYCTIKGDVPFTIGRSGTVYDNLGHNSCGYRASDIALFTNYDRLRFKGANCTIDFRFVSKIINGGKGDHWFDGCKLTQSGGRNELWGMGPRPTAYPADYNPWFTDVTIDGLDDAMKNASAVINCHAVKGAEDVVTGARLVYGSIFEDWDNSDLKQYLPAFTIRYTGIGSATIDWVSCPGGRRFVLKVDGRTVGQYDLYDDADAYFLKDANYRFSHLVRYVNTLSGWLAVLQEDSRRGRSLSWGAGSSGVNRVFTNKQVGQEAVQLYSYFDTHSDWFAQSKLSENQIMLCNKGIGFEQVQTYFLGYAEGGGMRDAMCANNAFQHKGSLNPPFQQIIVNCSHLIFAHNTYTSQDNKFGSGAKLDDNCLIACNSTPRMEVMNATITSHAGYKDNHVHGSNLRDPKGTNHTNGGTATSLYVDPAAGDFTPRGELLSSANLHKAVVPFDLNGAARAEIDCAGAVRKPV